MEKPTRLTNAAATLARGSLDPVVRPISRAEADPLPTQKQLAAWRRALFANPKRLTWLMEVRGLTKETITQAGLGWSDRQKRYMISIHDVNGQLINVRRYAPDPSKYGKILSIKGHGKPRLWAIGGIPPGDTRPVLGVEGEFDALLADQKLNADPLFGDRWLVCTGTDGADNVPPVEDLKLVAERSVYTTFDCDVAGRRGAEKFRDAMLPIAAEIRVANLGLDDGQDITDWFVTHKRDAAELKRLLRAAPHGSEPRRPTGELLRIAIDQKVDSEGSRNEAAFWLACQLRDERYTKAEAKPVLENFTEAVAGSKDEPFPASEALATLESAYSTPAREAVGAAGMPYDVASRSLRQSIDAAKQRLLIQETAKAEHEAAKAAARFFTLPRQTLEAALAVPRIVTPHRIRDLHKRGYSSTITARYKTGKTTLGANLLRSLADDEPFLDLYDVLPPDGRIGLINYELDPDEMLDWLSDVGIRKQDRIAILNLRGRTFTLAHEHNQEELINWSQDMEVEVLSLDPHRRAFSGFGKENDNDDVNRFTETLDFIKQEASISDLFLHVHTGRTETGEGSEHARGATALDDWADQRLVLTKDEEQRRFLYAEGRLPTVPEFQLVYDAESRRLTAEPGNRRTTRDEDFAGQAVMQVQNAGPEGLTTTEVQNALNVKHDKRVLAALRDAEAGGLVHSQPGRTTGLRWFNGRQKGGKEA